MRITRIISSNIEGNLRVLKHTPFKSLVKKNELLSDFGHDANPYPGIKGAYESATTSGRGAVLGFFNKYAVALHGENRHYSTLPNGSEQVTEIYQRHDGSILIRAGISGGVEKYSMLVNSDGDVVINAKGSHTETIDGAETKTVGGKIILNAQGGGADALKIIGGVTIDGPLHVTGNISTDANLLVAGTSTLTGAVTATTSIELAGTDLETHIDEHTHNYFDQDRWSTFVLDQDRETDPPTQQI